MRENRTNRKQSSKLAEDLKNVLDNMSQEQFDKEWEEIENQGFPKVYLKLDVFMGFITVKKLFNSKISS